MKKILVITNIITFLVMLFFIIYANIQTQNAKENMATAITAQTEAQKNAELARQQEQLAAENAAEMLKQKYIAILAQEEAEKQRDEALKALKDCQE